MFGSYRFERILAGTGLSDTFGLICPVAGGGLCSTYASAVLPPVSSESVCLLSLEMSISVPPAGVLPPTTTFSGQ